MIFRYPCELDSEYISQIRERIYYYDSLKELSISVQSLYYAAYILDYRINSHGESIPSIYGISPEKSGIRILDDGTMKSYCATSDEKKCSYLFAEVRVSKKITNNWIDSKVYNLFIDSLFQKNYSAKKVLKEISFYWKYDDLSERIPYELCWEKNGFSIPCHLDSKARIDKFVSKIEGGSLKAISFRGASSWAAFVDAVSEEHFCKSSDKKHCNKVWFLVESPTKLQEFELNLKTNEIIPVDNFFIKDVLWENGWSYYDTNESLKKVYDESGQVERDLKYFTK